MMDALAWVHWFAEIQHVVNLSENLNAEREKNPRFLETILENRSGPGSSNPHSHVRGPQKSFRTQPLGC